MDIDKHNNLHFGFELEKLVPELSRWNDGRGIDIVSWINGTGNFEHGIAYGRLFWQDFVEYDDCVLFAGFKESSYLGFMKHTGGNKEAVERVMNHHHLSDFFLNQEQTTDQIIYFGRLLQEIWQAKLKFDFPTRNVIAKFYEGENYDLWDYEITIFQPRDKATGEFL